MDDGCGCYPEIMGAYEKPVVLQVVVSLAVTDRAHTEFLWDEIRLASWSGERRSSRRTGGFSPWSRMTERPGAPSWSFSSVSIGGRALS